jgi:hypothetical protein
MDADGLVINFKITKALERLFMAGVLSGDVVLLRLEKLMLLGDALETLMEWQERKEQGLG